MGGKQQPGTSSHPHPSRLLAPDPLIRVSVITPPVLQPPPPAQDGNSTLNTGQQQPAQGHHPPKNNPKSFRSLSPKATPPSLCTTYRLSAKCQWLFFCWCWCCALANPWLVGELSRRGYLCTQTTVSLPQAGARNTCVRQRCHRRQVRREVTFGRLSMVK